MALDSSLVRLPRIRGFGPVRDFRTHIHSFWRKNVCHVRFLIKDSSEAAIIRAAIVLIFLGRDGWRFIHWFDGLRCGRFNCGSWLRNCFGSSAPGLSKCGVTPQERRKQHEEEFHKLTPGEQKSRSDASKALGHWQELCAAFAQESSGTDFSL